MDAGAGGGEQRCEGMFLRVASFEEENRRGKGREERRENLYHKKRRGTAFLIKRYQDFDRASSIPEHCAQGPEEFQWPVVASRPDFLSATSAYFVRPKRKSLMHLVLTFCFSHSERGFNPFQLL